MTWQKVEIHAHDELLHIGSGRRTVEAKIGRVWVKLRTLGKIRRHDTIPLSLFKEIHGNKEPT